VTETNTDCVITINRPVILNGGGTGKTKKEKEVLIERGKKLKRSRLMSMRDHEIVQCPLIQLGRTIIDIC